MKNNIRLILGNGRSGTSWLSQVLAKTSTPIRFFNEPLSKIEPGLNFSKKYDHTAIKFDDNNNANKLVKSYQILASKKSEFNKIIENNLKNKLKRDDENFEFCLIKEVHSLLVTEYIVKKLKAKTIFITRNPLYVVDSQISAQGINSMLWKNEYQYIKDDIFLDRYFPETKNIIKNYLLYYNINSFLKNKKIISKILIVSIINNMLKKIAENNNTIIYITYENLCLDPEKNFIKLANFFNFNINEHFLNSIKKRNHQKMILILIQFIEIQKSK